MWALAVLGLMLLLVLAFLGGLVLRRQLLRRHGGTVNVAMRLRSRRPGYGWAMGLGRYDGECLLWYRLLSLAPRPRRVVPRHGLAVQARREPKGLEARNLVPGAVIVECRTERGVVELAMSDAAYPGFLSWLEAAPSVGADIV